MVAVPTGQTGAISHFELTLTNLGSTPMRLTLSPIDPSGVLSIAVASPIVLNGGEVQRLPLEAKQVRAAPAGSRTLQFQVVAQQENGARAGFVNVTAIPAGGAGKAGTTRWIAIGAGVVVVAAAVGGVVLLQGGGKEAPSTTPTAQVTSQTTVTATAGTKSIQALDRWDYRFAVTGNDCSFGLAVGDQYPVSFRFKPATGSGTMINDGEKVTVTGIQDREIPLGTFTFHFVDFEFTYPVAGSDGRRGTATIRTTFGDATTIKDASLTERYDSPSCTITAKPAP